MSILRRILLSLLTQPVKPAIAEARSLAAFLRDGDDLLTEGNTRVAALVQRLTKSTWAHVAMYVGPLEGGPDPRCIVEADVAEGVRSIRLSELECVNVRVLRPVGLDDGDRARLAKWVVSRIGGEYDLKHACTLARRLLPAPPKANLPPVADGATRFICSTLLASAFALVGAPIPPLRTVSGAADPRYVIPSDFERASGFEIVV